MIFPIPSAKYKLINYLYKNGPTKISNLLNSLSISQKVGYDYITQLLKAGVIKESLEGKKPLLRVLEPNLKTESGKLCFSLVELEKKINFFECHKKLIGPFIQFELEARDLVECAVIFGSYARNGETKESDIDIALFTREVIRRKIEKITEKAFSTLEKKVSIRIFNADQFNKEDGLISQIIKEHIVIIKPYRWVELLSGLAIMHSTH
ncbi:nucleotidyltransferase domain-containing protein [archaeon]|nr:nucleotidyltransferase domain-containing protein [archaeon]